MPNYDTIHLQTHNIIYRGIINRELVHSKALSKVISSENDSKSILDSSTVRYNCGFSKGPSGLILQEDWYCTVDKDLGWSIHDRFQLFHCPPLPGSTDGSWWW
jgi:hypothetical protein